MELSPGSFRTFVVGTSYQLGNLVSSASSTIEATIGERYPLAPLIKPDGKQVNRYQYGKVIAIFMGAVFAYVIILTIIGPEALGKDLDVGHDKDMQEATGRGFVEKDRGESLGSKDGNYSGTVSGSDEEKSDSGRRVVNVEQAK